MPELKPCPFCGGSAKIYASTTRIYPNHGKHYCYCEKCLASGPSFSDLEDDGSSVFKAIEAWNKREEPMDAITVNELREKLGLEPVEDVSFFGDAENAFGNCEWPTFDQLIASNPVLKDAWEILQNDGRG